MNAEPPPPAPPTPPAPKKGLLPETTEGMPWPSNHEIKKESNPFTDRDWRMFGYAWSGMIVRLVIIFGGLFSVYQYLETSEEKRIAATFALLETWEKDGYDDAQIAVRQRIADLNAKYRSLLGPNPTPVELAVYMDRIGLQAMTEDGGSMPLPEFKAKFDRLVFFLNRVATCVQSGQCSRQVTDDYFRDLSVSFWNYFAKYSRQMRAAGSTMFSVPIEEYVTGKRPDIQTQMPTSTR